MLTGNNTSSCWGGRTDCLAAQATACSNTVYHTSKQLSCFISTDTSPIVRQFVIWAVRCGGLKFLCNDKERTPEEGAWTKYL